VTRKLDKIILSKVFLKTSMQTVVVL